MTEHVKYALFLALFCSALAHAMAPTKSISIDSIKNNSDQDAYLLYYYVPGEVVGMETLEAAGRREEKDFFPLENAFYILRGTTVDHPALQDMTVAIPADGKEQFVQLVIATKKGLQYLPVRNYGEIVIEPDGGIKRKY